MKQGDVVIIEFPFTDLITFKKRPAIVVSNARVQSPDVMICEVTTKGRVPELEVKLTSDDMKRGELPKVSYVRPFRVLAVHKTLVNKVVGTLSDEKVKELFNKIVLHLEVLD